MGYPGRALTPFFAYDANYLIDNKVGIASSTPRAREPIAWLKRSPVTQTMVGPGPPAASIFSPKGSQGDTVYGAAGLDKVADGSQDRTARSGVG